MAEDSRLVGHHGSVTHPTLPFERTYCIFCGKPKGWVSQESYAYIELMEIIVVCDDCEQSHGSLGLPPADIREVA